MSRVIHVRGLGSLSRKLDKLASLDLRDAEKAGLDALAEQADNVLRRDGHNETPDLREETESITGNWTVVQHQKSSRLINGSEAAMHHEFGTGTHNPFGGRDTEWTYQTTDGRYVRTRGITPVAFLRRAADENEGKIADAVGKHVKKQMKGIGR